VCYFGSETIFPIGCQQILVMILMHLFTLSHLEGLLFKKLNLFTIFVSFHRVNSVLSILFFSVDITLNKS
jgi:hypothetical protein